MGNAEREELERALKRFVLKVIDRSSKGLATDAELEAMASVAAALLGC